MKSLFILLMVSNSLCAVHIPKSSLEAVKNEIATKLAAAQEKNDSVSIEKFQQDLVNIEKKIKKFELEWLEYRKNQLAVKSGDAAAAELKEIDQLIKARS